MKKHFALIIIFLLMFLLSSCKKETTTEGKQTMNVTYEESVIMEGSYYETKVYIIDSGIDGKNIAIIGGTHGDEQAGYTAALKFKDKLINSEYYFTGKILMIPEANKLGITKNARKPSPDSSTTSDETWNLNRQFPGNANGTETEKLAYSIVKVIEDFGAKYFIDLHESRYSHTESKGGDQYEWLGETLICGNATSSAAADTIIKDYNQKYSGADFDYKMNPEAKSFNDYFSGSYYYDYRNDLSSMGYSDTEIAKMKSYLRCIAFTIETTKTYDLDVRVNEHINMLDCILNYIYSN